MPTGKKIFKILVLTIILTGFGQLLPGFSTLYDNYVFGFFLTLVGVLIFHGFHKAYMARMAKLPPDVQKKIEKESQEWDEETSEAVFSPTQQHDLRNLTDI